MSTSRLSASTAPLAASVFRTGLKIMWRARAADAGTVRVSRHIDRTYSSAREFQTPAPPSTTRARTPRAARPRRDLPSFSRSSALRSTRTHREPPLYFLSQFCVAAAVYFLTHLLVRARMRRMSIAAVGQWGGALKLKDGLALDKFARRLCRARPRDGRRMRCKP